MITLHKLGHPDERFQLNPDLIVSVEATPDTVITLTTAAKVLVCETPEEIEEAVRAWHGTVLAIAFGGRARGVWGGEGSRVMADQSGR